MGENSKNKRRCSFCGRPESEVGFLITGLNGYICDSCSQQAYEIVQEAMKGSASGANSLDLKELPKPVEIKEFLDQYVIGQDAAKRYLSVKTGFFTALINELKNLLKNPKKLIPTFVLSAVWLVFSLMSSFGANIPVLRFFYTLTYANGGMFGGFFGAIGGIFGKAVFATVINTIVLSLFAKKNPFANSAKSLTGVFGKAAFSGLSAISPKFWVNTDTLLQLIRSFICVR